MQAAWPAPLTVRATTLLLERGRLVRYQRGEAIARQGEVAGSMYILLEGQADVVVVRPSGREFVLYILGPGEGYSFLHIYHQIPRTSSLVARTRCQLLVLPRQMWLQTADECPELKDAVISVLCHRMRSVTDVLEFSNMAPAIARLAHRLVLHVRRVAPMDAPDPIAQPHFEVAVTQATLASMLSLSRQRTHALLHQLEATGAIQLSYGRILVCDLAILRRIMAESEPD